MKMANVTAANTDEILRLHKPRGAAIALILDSPHSRSEFPADLVTTVDRDTLRRSEDCFIPELFSGATAIGAHLLEAMFPRTYVDLNRKRDEIDVSMFEGAWCGPVDLESSSVRRESGLFWKTCYPNLSIYSGKLKINDAVFRITNYYEPYHEYLAKMIDKLRVAHRAVYHLNCHSMPTVSSGEKSPEGSLGSKRPMVNLGDRNGTSCSASFTSFLYARFQDLGYDTTINVPYNAAFLTSGYPNPTDKRNSIQIELRRDIYMTELTFLPNAGFPKLQSDILRILLDLRNWILDSKSAALTFADISERRPK